MFRRTLWLFKFLAISIVVLSMAACSAKPENSPVIRKKFAEVDEMKTENQELVKEVRTLMGDVTVLKDQVSNLRALSPDASGEIDVVNRIEQLEARLSKLETGQTVIASASKPATSTHGSPPLAGASSDKDIIRETIRSAAQETRTEPKPVVHETKTQTKPAVKTVAVSTAPKPAPKPTTPRGHYYTIESGDSLESIAAKNGVSLDALKKANHLPPGARPLKGQRLFIPAK
ncbi:LysM peptidoglycan-binding domain-containing protein [bacterium]|nr:LysM peptidoglycan-binding domain-containing protein [bacterium]